MFRMVDCRVQSARKRKGLPDFPCKSVGLVEYEWFAKTIDPRIETRCICCPPDAHPDDVWCEWEFIGKSRERGTEGQVRTGCGRRQKAEVRTGGDDGARQKSESTNRGPVASPGFRR